MKIGAAFSNFYLFYKVSDVLREVTAKTIQSSAVMVDLWQARLPQWRPNHRYVMLPPPHYNLQNPGKTVVLLVLPLVVALQRKQK